MTLPPQANVTILDTCVFSYIYDEKPEAEPYKPHLMGAIPAVAFITVGELLAGAYHDNWSPGSLRNLQEYLRNYLIIPYDEAGADQWAHIQTARRGLNISRQ